MYMNQFIGAVKALVEKTCWGVTAGEGTGSVIGVDFGKKINRKRPLSNIHLSEEQRNFQGEYDLFVECSWRIDSQESVVCGSKDANESYGTMVSGLNRIVGQRIVAVNANLPAYDLELRFDNDLILKIFCDETNESEDCDNYTFGTPEQNYIVGCRSQLSIEERNLY